MNLLLKSQLSEQATEYKKLQDDFELAKNLADKHITDDFKLKNAEQLLEETKLNNRAYMK
jgi:hypothetical protein